MNTTNTSYKFQRGGLLQLTTKSPSELHVSTVSKMNTYKIILPLSEQQARMPGSWLIEFCHDSIYFRELRFENESIRIWAEKAFDGQLSMDSENIVLKAVKEIKIGESNIEISQANGISECDTLIDKEEAGGSLDTVSLQNELIESKQRIKILEEALADKIEQILQNEKISYDQQNKKLQNLLKNIEELKNNNRELSNQIEELNRQVGEEEERKRKIQQERESKLFELQTLRTAVSLKESDLSQLQTELSDFQEELRQDTITATMLEDGFFADIGLVTNSLKQLSEQVEQAEELLAQLIKKRQTFLAQASTGSVEEATETG